MNKAEAIATGRLAAKAPKSTKRQMEQTAEKLGATIDWDCGNAFTIDAPDGSIFVATGSPSLVTTCEEDGVRFMAEAYADAIERMSYGLTVDDDATQC